MKGRLEQSLTEEPLCWPEFLTLPEFLIFLSLFYFYVYGVLPSRMSVRHMLAVPVKASIDGVKFPGTRAMWVLKTETVLWESTQCS